MKHAGYCFPVTQCHGVFVFTLGCFQFRVVFNVVFGNPLDFLMLAGIH